MLFLAECRDAFSGVHELKVSNQSVQCSFVSVSIMDTATTCIVPFLFGNTIAWFNDVIIYTVLWSLAAGDTCPFKQHNGSKSTKSRKEAYQLCKVLSSIQ